MHAFMTLMSPEGRKTYGKQYQTVRGSQLPTFEKLRQNSGFVLYETILHFNDTKTQNRLLKISKPRDRVYIFVGNVS